MNIKTSKVLMYSNELSVSGAPIALFKFATILKKKGYDIELWCNKDGNGKDLFCKIGVSCRVVTFQELNKIDTIKQIYSFDFSVANTILSYPFYNISSSLIPTIWYIHEAYLFSSYSYDLEKLLARSSDLVAISEYSRTALRNYCKNNIEILPTIIDDFYLEEKFYYRKLTNRNKLNFLVIGYFHPTKGQDIVCNTFSSLPDSISDLVHCYFIGRNINDYYSDYVMNKILNSDNMSYIGELSDQKLKFDYMREADVVIVASREESFSIVTLEAAMMAKPIVITENVGIKDIVDNHNGWIIKSIPHDKTKLSFLGRWKIDGKQSSEDLIRVINDCISNREKLVDMGRISRQRFLNNYSKEKYEEKLVSIISKYSSVKKGHKLLKISVLLLKNILNKVYCIEKSKKGIFRIKILNIPFYYYKCKNN